MKWFLFVFFVVSVVNGQSLQLKTCTYLLEDVVYSLERVVTDETNRNVFQTIPLVGDQPCSGIGICELQIAWNELESRWEISADDGNGDFVSTYLLYYSSVKSIPDPPTISDGNWIENIAITNELCGEVEVFSGDTNTMNIEQQKNIDFLISPNPVRDSFKIVVDGISVDKVACFSLSGEKITDLYPVDNYYDVSEIAKGVYMLEVLLSGRRFFRKLIIQ
ncbi:MAG: T9SS type A sorting domain-containing protein [Flavicella sp.]